MGFRRFYRILSRRATVAGSLFRFWKQFGSGRLLDELPKIQDGMERFYRLALPQEAGARRFELINAAILARGYRTYLEIGVRNPADCFDRVIASAKWSVDPGLEWRANPVDFPMTSDAFFQMLDCAKPASCPDKWDVVFIDGLHRAEQVWRDIQNAKRFLSDRGMIFLHDCLPPSEAFARERFEWTLESGMCWNGSCWKAIARYFEEGAHHACIVDSDWGVGVIDAARVADRSAWPARNQFFEFDLFVEMLGRSSLLVTPNEFCVGLKEFPAP